MKRKVHFPIVIASLFGIIGGCSSPGPRIDTTGYSLKRDPLIELTKIDPRIKLDVRYATENNFIGRAVYPSSKIFIRKSVAERLSRVQDRLVKQNLGLKVFDGYRPLGVQREMWKVLPDPKFVANPARGSRHNRGMAVDVALVDSQGRDVEMPTKFDDFTEAAGKFYAGGTESSRRNRDLLVSVMEAEGFTGLNAEWWHFDAPGWREYPVLDIDLEQIP